MRKTILGWVLLALTMLGSSAVLGQLILIVLPSAREHNSYAPVGWAPPPAPLRNENLMRAETTFSGPFAAAPFEMDELIGPIRAATEQDALPVNDWSALFDQTRMAEAEVSLGFYRLRNVSPTSQSVAEAGASIREDLEALRERPNGLPSGVVQIVRVSWSSDRQEALVVAKHTATRGQQKVVQYVRWWLVRGGGGWQIYDFEFADTRLRFLAVRNYLFHRPARGTGDEVPPGFGPPERVDGSDVIVYSNYHSGLQWLALADGAKDDVALERAKDAERAFADGGQIDPVIAARKAFQQRLAVLAGKPNAAQTYATLARLRWANTPHSILAAATTHNAQKNYAEALKSVKQYRVVIGDDPEAYREEAKAQTGLKNDPKAGLAVIQMGLMEFPGDQGLLMELARRTPDDERETVGEAIAKAATANVLLTAAELFENQPALLDALCVGYLRAKPADTIAQMQGVHAKVALGQLKPAAELLKTIRTADAKGWPSFRTDLLVDDRIEKRVADYYQLFTQIDEAVAGYRELANRFSDVGWFDAGTPMVQRQMKALEALNALHAAKHPADPELGLWRATLLWARGDAAKADAELVTAMAKLKKPTTPDRRVFDPEKAGPEHETDWNVYRHLRTRCLLKLGKWKQAYDELPPAMETFDQLAAELDTATDATALGELVELHAKKQPNDKALMFWRGEVQFLRRNYDAAIEHFVKAAMWSLEQNAASDFRTDERLVRAFLRLKRPTDALVELKRMESPVGHGPQPLLRVLVAIGLGDPDAVLGSIDRYPELATRVYADPDGQGLLTKPEFDRVRQKYPPPVR